MGRLLEYHLGDRTYQFDEDDVPAGAVLVTKADVPAKAHQPVQNKARKPSNKAKTPENK